MKRYKKIHQGLIYKIYNNAPYVKIPLRNIIKHQNLFCLNWSSLFFVFLLPFRITAVINVTVYLAVIYTSVRLAAVLHSPRGIRLVSARSCIICHTLAVTWPSIQRGSCVPASWGTAATCQPLLHSLATQTVQPGIQLIVII